MVLHIIPSISLQSGGPRKSLENIMSFRVSDETLVLRNSKEENLRINSISFIHAFRSIVYGKYTALHIHSIWNPLLTLFAIVAVLCRTKLILSPRGMLEYWVLHKKKVKKSIALKTYVWFLFRRSAVIVASSEQEKRSIQRVFNCHHIKVISNGYAGKIYERSEMENKRLSIVYFGRIHKKKGLDILIDSVKKLETDYILRIVGCEKNECEDLIKDVNNIETYPFMGYDGLKKILLQSQIFVFPTQSENFGNSILEALAHGIFVITTKESSWWSLNEQKGGMLINRDSSSFKDAIMRYSLLSKSEKILFSNNASNYAKSHLMKNLINEWNAIYD